MSEIADSPAILRSTSQEVSVLRGKFGTVSDRMLAWWFITPTILLLLAINIFPLIWTVYLSFTNFKANRANRGVEWIGLANYRRILSDSDVWAAMQVTAHFVFWSILLQVVLGFGLALLLDKRFRGHGLWTTIILLPMMLSPAVVGTFWSFLFQPQIGLFNTIVGFFTGIDPSSFQMIGDVPLAPWAIVLVDTWMWTPYVMLICLAGLRSIPDYIYEAAEIDRASAWRQFWSITVPMVLATTARRSCLLCSTSERALPPNSAVVIVSSLAGNCGPTPISHQSCLLAVAINRRSPEQAPFCRTPPRYPCSCSRSAAPSR